jgi:predicted enzyme related to lactoylglutathione lyase
MGSPIVHWEINSQNPEQLHEFYGKLFDWHVEVMPEMGYGSVDPHGEGGRGIGGGIGRAQGPNQVTFYIEVGDPQAYLDKIEAAGGKTVVPVTAMGDVVTFAQFADPDGNVVGLVKGEQQG